MAGKGDKARPLAVDRKTFDSNWDAIFNNKDVRGDKPKKNGQDDKVEGGRKKPS